MSRSSQYQDGQRNGIKACVTWLYDEAASMRDPKARGILSDAAFHMGVSFKTPKEPIAAPITQGEPK